MGSAFQQAGLLWLRDPEEHRGGSWGLPGQLGCWVAPVLPWDPALSAPGLASSAPHRHRRTALPRPLPLADRAPRCGAWAAGPAGCSPPAFPKGRAWGSCYPTPPPPTCSSDLGRVLPALSLGQAAHLPCSPSACSSQKGLQSWEVRQKEPEKRPEAAEVGLQALSADPARLVSAAPRLSGGGQRSSWSPRGPTGLQR